jgi:hypothetical protein
MSAAALLLSAALAAALPRPDREALQWRAHVGASLDPTPHGVLDLGVKKGDWSAELLTDTLDLRWSPELGWGRAWVGLRGELLIAGLLPSPWRDGAPDPASSLFASYAGGQAGVVAYLPHGLYAEASADGRWYVYGATAETQIAVPDDQLLIALRGAVGWWREAASARFDGGVDLLDGRVQPRLALSARVSPEWTIGPHLELRAELASDLERINYTRVGGLNPYVVPLGGAGWAELLAEDLAAVRVGPKGRWSFGAEGAWTGEASLFFDLVAMTVPFETIGRSIEVRGQKGRVDWGLAATLVQRWHAWFAELAVGFAPELERQPGVSRASLWLVLGRGWDAL